MMFTSSSPAAKRCSWSRTSRWARGHIALLAPPTCGEISRPGASQSGWSSGSGSGSTTSSAARSRPGVSSATRASVSTTGAAGDVDQQGAVLHRGQERRVDQAAGLVGERYDEHDDVGVGQQLRAARRSRARRRGRERATRTTSTSNGTSRASIGLADRAVPDQQHALVGQRRAPAGLPLVPVLGAHEVGDAAQDGQDQGERQLGGRGVVDAAAVAERDAVRDPAADVVDAGGQGLHDLEAASSAAAPRATSGPDRVRRHVEPRRRPPLSGTPRSGRPPRSAGPRAGRPARAGRTAARRAVRSRHPAVDAWTP